KAARRALRRAVLAQQAHVEMAVIGRAFGLAMPRRRWPGTRQVVEAVPMDTRRPADEQLGGARETPFLHFLGAEAGDADLRDPDRQVGHRADLLDLGRPLVDHPEIPIERE